MLKSPLNKMTMLYNKNLHVCLLLQHVLILWSSEDHVDPAALALEKEAIQLCEKGKLKEGLEVMNRLIAEKEGLASAYNNR